MLTAEEALTSLATTAATAAVEALSTYAAGEAELGDVAVALHGRDPLAGVSLPAVIASATNDKGGATVFVIPPAVARRLAEAAGAAGGEGDLDAAELEALRDVAGRIREAAVTAIGASLGIEIAAGVPDARVAESARDVKVGAQGASRATVAQLSVFGEECHLVQLVPSDVVMRIAADSAGAAPADAAVRQALGSTLREVPLRVWAEVGRARLRSAEVASLGDGAIVELDRAADDPVDLYVNGSRIGTGRLVCIDGKEWAVRLEEVFASAEADPAA